MFHLKRTALAVSRYEPLARHADILAHYEQGNIRSGGRFCGGLEAVQDPGQRGRVPEYWYHTAMAI